MCTYLIEPDNTYEQVSRLTVTDPTAAVLTVDPNSEVVLVAGTSRLPTTISAVGSIWPRRQALLVSGRQHLLHRRRQQFTESYEHVRQGAAP